MADLVGADVRFLVAGGIACALNGFVRTTEDLDLLVDSEPENVRALLRVLATFGDGHARELSVADFGDEEGAVRLIEDFPVDLFTRMGGRRYADLLPYREIHGGDVPIPFVGAKGLILLKTGSPRLQDRIDVEALRQLLAEAGD
ncbi:MAG: hypothetical protein AB1726_18845 [Planctomycetota bacterium]